MCLNSSTFPTDEKVARVIPIYKSEKRTLMDNYRPISILPAFSKIFESLIHDQLSQYLEEHKLLSKFQFGFRKNRNAQQAVTILTDHIRINMDKGRRTGTVFVDLSKAFDTADHACIINKLNCYGIENVEQKWFENYLFNRKQTVEYNGVSSEQHDITTGVPQGSILGPLLFIILINDLYCNLENCEVLLYADDTVLYFSGKDPVIIESALNLNLEKMAIWFNENNLVLNLKKGKTEGMLFGTKSFETISLKIFGKPINITDYYKYLGVTLDRRLNLSLHMENIYKRASSRVKLLRKIRHNVTPYVAERIYKMMILPLTMYCSNIYVMNPLNRLQSLQDRSYKIIYNQGYNKSTSSCCLRSISDEAKRRCLLEVFKIVNNVNTPSNFDNYFMKQSHNINTRGNKNLLKLDKVKTASGRRSFKLAGAIFFNELPSIVRLETSLAKFKHALV